MIQFLEEKILLESTVDAHQIATRAPMFTMIGQTLYYLDVRQPEIKRIVVPKHLWMQIMQDNHSGHSGWSMPVQDFSKTMMVGQNVHKSRGFL